MKTSKSLRNDDIIETIRILIKIFYKVKSYKALLDYQNYFQEFKASGEIQTALSLRKFTSNIKWINKYTYLAPSYQVNWKALNGAVMACKLRFNPLIKKDKVDLVIEKLPFFIFSKSSESNFSIEVAGWFVIPYIYLKDLRSFLEKLEQNGYIIKMSCILLNSFENFLNLNYFREFYKNKRIINPNHAKYDDRYEIHFKFDYGREFIDEKYSILDFLILERIRYYSITGFSFERRTETLNTFKSDLINEIISQRTMINTLRENLEIIHNREDLQELLLRFLENNKKKGFFYLKEYFTNITSCLSSITNIVNENPSIKTEYSLIEYLNNQGISKNLKDNIIFRKKEIRKILFQEFIPLIFKKKQKFTDKIKEFQTLTNFFNSCSDLKIFSLDSIITIVHDENLVEEIYKVKERKLKKSYETYKNRNITSSDIDDIIDEYINRDPPLIKPLLISTFSTNNFASYYLHIFIKKTDETRKNIDEFKKYFPRLVIYRGKDNFTNEELILIEIYLPNIIEREKFLLISILSNLFKDNLITIRRYFFDGFQEAFSRREFYDFESSEFFYTKDLFIDFFKFCKQVLGKSLPYFQESINNTSDLMHPDKIQMDILVQQIEDRISRDKVEFNINELDNLSNFNINLKDTLADNEKFKELKQKAFFKRYISSIKFKPALNRFGLGIYYLYIRPIELKELDMKLLLTNSFQKIKYPAFVDNAPSFLIKYIFPQDNPNKTHLNHITKSAKVVSEYCLFKIVRNYQIFHLDRNLDSNGWSLSDKAFKAHSQKILFNPEIKVQNLAIKELNLGSSDFSNIFGPNSKEFNDLTNIYNFKSLNLRSILGSNKKTQINLIETFLKDNIIFPILKLKNLGLQEKIYIILLDIEKELIPKIVNIFYYFPIVSCYEIEGEYFISGSVNEKEKRFENGVLIKLYFPEMDISSFQKIFDSIFDYLNIKKRLVLTDMIDGSEMIRSIFGNLDFLKAYNPLKNFIWSEIDKKWMNIKLYGENFVKKYPDLV